MWQLTNNYPSKKKKNDCWTKFPETEHMLKTVSFFRTPALLKKRGRKTKGAMSCYMRILAHPFRTTKLGPFYYLGRKPECWPITCQNHFLTQAGKYNSCLNPRGQGGPKPNSPMLSMIRRQYHLPHAHRFRWETKRNETRRGMYRTAFVRSEMLTRSKLRIQSGARQVGLTD